MQAVSDQNLPAELFPNYCTLEYTIQSQMQPSPPAYIFVVDTCLAEDELAACRAALSQALQLIPEYAQVTFIGCLISRKTGYSCKHYMRWSTFQSATRASPQ